MNAAAEVGPVLHTGLLANAVIAAILDVHPQARIVDRGAYIRVTVPSRCSFTRQGVESHAGHAFKLPSDLEAIMPSFRGRFRVSEDEASWEAPR